MRKELSPSNIAVIDLYGDHKEMGNQYGLLMKRELKASLSLLLDFFVEKQHIPYEKLVFKAQQFYNRYSYSYQLFIEGISETSGLSKDDCVILNAMETLNSLVADSFLTECAFISIPRHQTQDESVLIGRNYDFPPPFDEIAGYLTVTVVHESNKIPTAFISMPGQIYCPSCVNAKGIFMELNNGMPSGGYWVDESRESLLIRLLEILQNSPSLTQTEKMLDGTESDYSLIINTADANRTKAYEFSSTKGMKPYFPSQYEPYASTNFYLNKTWKGIPAPTDNTTWHGVTRRNNLLRLASKFQEMSVDDLKSIMNVQMKNGGAVWDFTIYQIIFNSYNLNLYVRPIKFQKAWTEIRLANHFNTPPKLSGAAPVRAITSIKRDLSASSLRNAETSSASSTYKNSALITAFALLRNSADSILSLIYSDGDSTSLADNSYDYGAWNEALTRENNLTGDQIFVYEIYRNGEVVGDAEFYGQPWLCRTQEGHNVIKTTGVLSIVNIREHLSFDQVCEIMPPSLFDRVLLSAKNGAQLGAISGGSNVIGYTLQSYGVSQSVSSMVKDAALYSGYFAVRLAELSIYAEASTFSSSLIQALTDTSQFALVNVGFDMLLQCFDKASKVLSDQSYNGLAKATGCARSAMSVGIFAWNARTRGLIEAASSMGAGIFSRFIVETPIRLHQDRINESQMKLN